MPSLADRVVVITGGGSGIGRAICRHFAASGARVVASDRNLPGAEETVAFIERAGGQARAVALDVADAASVSAAFAAIAAEFERIDILVNNAAISEGNDLTTIDEATWDRTVDIVLKGAFLCAKAVLPGMIARKSGVILNIASVNGQTGIGEEPYSAAKAGLINLTQNLATRHGPDGIRANVICPGTVRTPIWNERLAADPAIFDRIAAWYPLRRVGDPDDIARAARFLCSDDASWITGATLNVDGGLMAGLPRFGEHLAGG